MYYDEQAEKNRAAALANNLQKGNSGPMRLYVGSLHFNITEDMLRGIFEPFGRVGSKKRLFDDVLRNFILALINLLIVIFFFKKNRLIVFNS